MKRVKDSILNAVMYKMLLALQNKPQRFKITKARGIAVDAWWNGRVATNMQLSTYYKQFNEASK